MDLMVAIGGTPSSHWRAAAALEVWEHWFPGGDTLKETTNGTVSFYYYPLARAGFFLEGGFGLSDYRMVRGLREGIFFENADKTFFKGFGWGARGAIGYDIRMSHVPWIKPRVSLTHARLGTLHDPFGTAAATGWKQNVLSAGLGVTIGMGS